MGDSELIGLLKLYFPTIPDETFHRFLSICILKKLKNKQDPFINELENKRYFIFVLKGIIRGYHTTLEGEERNVFLKAEGTFLGPPDLLFENRKSQYQFESILESEILLFDLEELENLISKDNELLKIYLIGLKENIVTLIGRIESLTEKQPEERYLDLINKHPIFFKKAFNKHIASYLGITPVSLSRIINRIRNANRTT